MPRQSERGASASREMNNARTILSRALSQQSSGDRAGRSDRGLRPRDGRGAACRHPIGLMPYRFAGRELHCARIREPANTSHHAEIERALLPHQDDDVFHVVDRPVPVVRRYGQCAIQVYRHRRSQRKRTDQLQECAAVSVVPARTSSGIGGPPQANNGILRRCVRRSMIP
jgi:hypothetical protein